MQFGQDTIRSGHLRYIHADRQGMQTIKVSTRYVSGIVRLKKQPSGGILIFFGQVTWPHNQEYCPRQGDTTYESRTRAKGKCVEHPCRQETDKETVHHRIDVYNITSGNRQMVCVLIDPKLASG